MWGRWGLNSVIRTCVLVWEPQLTAWHQAECSCANRTSMIALEVRKETTSFYNKGTEAQRADLDPGLRESAPRLESKGTDPGPPTPVL